MALTAPSAAPRWPAAIDPAAFDVDYEPEVDELTLFFGGHPVPSYSDPIAPPETGDLMLMVDPARGEVVGIHVYPFRAGALVDHPAWRALADPDPTAEAVAAFVADVAALYARLGVAKE